jgi:DNA-binding NarL/FixJ family response regulator
VVEIVRAIEAVSSGTAHFGPSIAQRVIDYFAAPRLSDPQIFPELTRREREILDRVARGQRNPVIAKELHLSPRTVRNHVSNIFNKLQVADRNEAIVRARKAGLGED